MQKASILAVLAHPDDESFGMGGTLALYASQGVNVHLVCATRGEAGGVKPEFMKQFNSISELRESELRCAAEIIGLKSVRYLDYRDSGMPGSADNQHPLALAGQPLEDVARKIIEIINDIRPQVILTFDPIGGYRHPDHIAIHDATVKAFEHYQESNHEIPVTGEYRPKKLYFHLMPRKALRFACWVLTLIGKDPRKFGANQDIDLLSISQVDFPIHAKINIRSVQKKKEQAGACHSSQGGGKQGGGLMAIFMKLLGGYEFYMRAYPPFQKGEKVEKELI